MSIRLIFVTVFCIILPLQAVSQSNGAAAAAGVAGGAALAAGAGQGAATPSSAGSSSAPIEMNIMVYGGLKKIAHQIAADVKGKLNATSSSPASILLEDSTSAPLITLYETWYAYQKTLAQTLSDLSKGINVNIVQVTAIQARIKAEIKATDTKQSQAKPPASQKGPKGKGGHNFEYQYIPPQQPASPIAPPTASPSSPGAATMPLGLTYLSGLTTALGAVKSGITYSQSTVQPVTQALTTALSHEFGSAINMYTSASPVNLNTATGNTGNIVTQNLAIQKQNADIQSEVNVDTSLPTLTDLEKTNAQLQADYNQAQADLKNIAAQIAANAATANQITTAFQTWTSSSDGSGSIILSDVLRGAAFSDAIGAGIPALQFSIDAAGGNTRTNNYFLFNLIYTPKPSFNAGLVVTYELRDGNNKYLSGDTLKVIYDYSKWKPKCYGMSKQSEVNTTDLGDGTFNKKDQTDKSFLCEVNDTQK